MEDSNGHDAEFGERLLIGSALGCHITVIHQCPQALLLSLENRLF
jgi:hypothetical protein